MEQVFFYQSVLKGETKGFTDYKRAFEYTFYKMQEGVTDATLYKMRFDLRDAEKLISPA